MKKEEILLRDPFVLLDGDRYYLYGSRGTSVFRAESPLGPFTPHSRGHITPHE